jgi:hypothetical protein
MNVIELSSTFEKMRFSILMDYWKKRHKKEREKKKEEKKERKGKKFKKWKKQTNN